MILDDAHAIFHARTRSIPDSVKKPQIQICIDKLVLKLRTLSCCIELPVSGWLCSTMSMQEIAGINMTVSC